MLAMLNQQFMAGCVYGQQGMQAEQFGNAVAAAQLYDQASTCIQQCMFMAQQSGVPVPENVHFTAALANFNSFRIKSVLGWGPMAWASLNQALMAINQAIILNPNQFQYHAFAGTTLLAMGDLPEAERALTSAQRLNPADPWTQYMLAFLYSLRGKTSVANQIYAPLQQMAPNLPPIPSVSPPTGGSTQAGTNWTKTVGDIAEMLTKVFGAIGGFQSMMQW